MLQLLQTALITELIVQDRYGTHTGEYAECGEKTMCGTHNLASVWYSDVSFFALKKNYLDPVFLSQEMKAYLKHQEPSTSEKINIYSSVFLLVLIRHCDKMKKMQFHSPESFEFLFLLEGKC